MPDDLPTSSPDTASRLARGMIIGVWLLILGFGTWFANTWLDSRQAADLPLVVASGSDGRGIELTSDRRGHFTVRGAINGVPVDFLVDTGASEISVPEHLAATLGLERGRRFPVNTANGTAAVFATRIDEVSVGNLSRQQLDAHINPGLSGDFALLGMNFLRHYELVQRDGRLLIREH